MSEKTESYWQRRAYQAEETLRAVAKIKTDTYVMLSNKEVLLDLQGLILTGASLADIDARIQEILR